MENLDDEEIQRLIEELFKSPHSLNSQGLNDDAVLYEVLFSELNKYPVASQDHLADKIVLSIEKTLDKKDKFYNILAITVLSFSFAAILTIAMVTINSPLVIQIRNFIHVHLSAFLYVLGMFIIIQIADNFINSRKYMASFYARNK